VRGKERRKIIKGEGYNRKQKERGEGAEVERRKQVVNEKRYREMR
jgi:hypothetical protein